MYFNKEFDSLINECLMHPKVQEMNNYKHHGISRLEHSIRVSYHTYKVCKFLHLNYKETTVAALLHDFFIDEVEKENGFNRLIHHPKYAAINAKEYFKINSFQEDIILKHMFPITPIPPRYLEGWIVDLIDNIASIYERCYSSAIAFASTINLVVVTLLGLLKF